jgi:hypothetical protein
VFVPKGTRRVEMMLPGFVPYQADMEIPARFFGLQLFPIAKPLSGKLEEIEPARALILGAVEYAAWSFAGEPTVTYQIPQNLSEGAYRSGPQASHIQQYTIMEDVLKGSARFTSTKAGLRDLIRAKYITDNGGLSSSPLSAIHSAQDILVYLSENPGTVAWLTNILPQETLSVLVNSPWYTKQIRAASVLSTQNQAINPILGESTVLESLMFRKIQGGTLIQNEAFPQEVRINTFSIAVTEVSKSSWEAFLNAHPEWAQAHTETLMAQGLVTEDYLLVDTAELGYKDSSTIPGVSWYAARAYCQWLTEFLPPDLADYEVRLPTEAEWEYAVRVALTQTSPGSLKDLVGGLWEWCEDPYTPYNFLPATQETIAAIGSPERVVRGGSWINSGSANWEEVRASLPPVSCSPFVSFRPVIAQKGGTP